MAVFVLLETGPRAVSYLTSPAFAAARSTSPLELVGPVTP
jgi:hypothetical protein